jgi:hypothetical protein
MFHVLNDDVIGNIRTMPEYGHHFVIRDTITAVPFKEHSRRPFHPLKQENQNTVKFEKQRQFIPPQKAGYGNKQGHKKLLGKIKQDVRDQILGPGQHPAARNLITKDPGLVHIFL